MKRGVILSASVLLGILFVITEAVAAKKEQKLKSQTSENRTLLSVETLPDKQESPNDINFDEDSNSSKVSETDEFENSLERLEKHSNAEILEWLKLENEEKANLAKVQNLVSQFQLGVEYDKCAHRRGR